MYIATYDALQYTLKDYKDTIFPESIHSCTPESFRKVTNHVIVSAVTISQTHTPTHVSVYHTLPHHVPHLHTSVLSGTANSFPQIAIVFSKLWAPRNTCVSPRSHLACVADTASHAPTQA